MRTKQLARSLALALLGSSLATGISAQPSAPAIDTESIGSKIWPGRYEEIEVYIKSATIVHMEDVGVGVTNPKRCELKPGGPVSRIAFKPIPPGRHRGFWDSYRSEIAAYELDKLLGLDMVPVAVERVVGGKTGAAIVWLDSVESWRDLIARQARPPDPRAWAVQIARMKMFDNLIGNTDRNAGNLLVDRAWNLLLIDHSRSLSGERDLLFEMDRIDRDLWDRIAGLSETDLLATLEPWVGKRNVEALLERRTRMQEAIGALIEEKGESGVFLR